MDWFVSTLEFLRDASEEMGSGDLAVDLIVLFLVFFLILLLVAIAVWMARRRSDVRTSEPDVLRGVKGRIEKFEMNLNSARTELAREVEFLKTRVTELELKVLSKEPPAEESQEQERSISDIPSFSVTLPGEPEQADELEQESATVEPDDSDEVKESAEESEEEVEESEREAAEVDDAAVEEIEPESLSTRLSKTRTGLFQKIKSIFSTSTTLDADTIEELQALLVSADLGVQMTEKLVEVLQEKVAEGGEVSEDNLLEILHEQILNILQSEDESQLEIKAEKRGDDPLVVLMVGVNGVGKTTTTAKLASLWKSKGASVLMVAADTFRAAATQQLIEWGERISVPVVIGEDEAKPATVVFDAMERARKENVDVVIVDTAGRLHTRANLMQELEGVRNVIQKHVDSAPHEVVLVLDGSTGQNALSQAREFHESVDLTGLIVTKLDGTPRGGIVVAIQSELGVPVRYIGVGEATEDLRVFDADEFVNALLDKSSLDELEQESAHGQRRRRRRDDPDSSIVH